MKRPVDGVELGDVLRPTVVADDRSLPSAQPWLRLLLLPLIMAGTALLSTSLGQNAARFGWPHMPAPASDACFALGAVLTVWVVLHGRGAALGWAVLAGALTMVALETFTRRAGLR